MKTSGVKHRTVYNVVNRYKETGTANDRKRSGRPRTKRTPHMLKALKARISRNPCRSQKKLGLQMNMSRKTISRALHEDLGLKALRRGTSHMLNTRLKKNRRIR